MRPLRYATLLAGAYLAVAGAYVVLSNRIAERLEATVGALGHIETVKGILFVTATAMLMFVVSLVLFRRLQRATGALEAQSRALVESQQRALVGLLAASVAHDFNNVLTVLAASASQLQRLDDLPPKARKLVGDMAAGTERGADLARRLANAGRQAALDHRAEVDLVSEVDACLSVVRSHDRVRRCEVRVVATGPERARVYPGLVYQMVANLTINAGEATGGRGRIEIRVSGDDTSVHLEVHDDGPGIPEAKREEVQEPFVTTKPAGTGLGLLSVRTCARLHGGAVDIGESDLGGAKVAVHLPRVTEKAEAAA